MKNYTKEEIIAFLDESMEKTDKEIEITKGICNDGKNVEDFESDEYLGTKAMFFVATYANQKFEESSDLIGLNREDVEEEYQYIKKKTEKFKNNFRYNITLDGDGWEGEVDRIYWVATWWEIKSDNTLELIKKSKARQYLAEKLTPEGYNNGYRTAEVHCNALKMYLDDEITLKGLIKMTFEGCEL